MRLHVLTDAELYMLDMCALIDNLMRLRASVGNFIEVKYEVETRILFKF